MRQGAGVLRTDLGLAAMLLAVPLGAFAAAPDGVGPAKSPLAALSGHLTEPALRELGCEPGALEPLGHELAQVFLQRLAAPGQVFPGGATREGSAGKAPAGPVAALMAHRVSLLGGYPVQDLGDSIDWFRAPKGDLQWPTHLSRHYWLRPLAHAWRGEGDAEAAGKVIAVLLDWVATTPMGVETLHWSGVRTADPERWPGCPEGFFKGYVDGPWTSLSAHARLDAWSELLALLWDAPQMTNDSVAILLLSLARDHRLSMLNNPRAMNQFQGIAVSLIRLGWWYPFLAGAEEAGTVGWDRLVRYAQTEIYPDGSMAECSPNYAAGCLNRLFTIVRDATARRAAVPPVMHERIALANRYFACIADPLGRAPRIAKGQALVLGMLAAINAEFDDPEVAFVASKGAAGRPPAGLSRMFNWAGHLAARSGWTPDADWVFFEPGPRGSGHADTACLNLQVQAKGAWLLTDPGYYSYSAAGAEGAMSLYLRSTAAHNAALIDGHGQVPVRPGERRGPNTAAGDYGWSDDGATVQAGGVYDYGFGPDGAIAVIHQRRLRYHRTQRLIEIEDSFAGGEGGRDVALHWQFPPEATVSVDGTAMRVGNGPAQALMTFAATVPLDLAVVSGRQDPPGGWYSETYGKLVPAPMGVVAAKATLPLRIHTTIALH